MRNLSDERLTEICRSAAELIERHGFTQHDRERTAGLTLDSALCEATHPLAANRDPGQHPPDCDEATERLMGWMLATGVTYLPYRVDAGNVVAAWNDERRRTADEVTALLRGFAAVLGDQLGTLIRECWSQSQRDVAQCRERHNRKGIDLICQRLLGLALAHMMTAGVRGPTHLTVVMHDVHDYARDVLGMDLDGLWRGL